MNRSTWWLAVAIAVSACSGGGGGGGGSPGTGDACAWFSGANCWKTAAAAATACTDGTATGAFDGPATTVCTYADATTVQFDPTATATASVHQDLPWDFTVVSSTAATCARYVETENSKSLTTPVGTFTESWVGGTSLDITCPDGSSTSIDMQTALNSLENCPADLPGWAVSYSPSGGPISFSFMGMGSGDTVLWRCQ